MGRHGPSAKILFVHACMQVRLLLRPLMYELAVSAQERVAENFLVAQPIEDLKISGLQFLPCFEFVFASRLSIGTVPPKLSTIELPVCLPATSQMLRPYQVLDGRQQLL